MPRPHVRTGKVIPLILLALPLSAAALHATPVRFSFAVDGQADRPIAGKLRLLPSNPGGEGATAQPMERTIEIPGELEIGLPEEGSWQAEVEAEGFWAAPQTVIPRSSGNGIRLRLFPAGRLLGRIILPRDEREIPSVSVRFQTTPSRSPARSLEGTVTCPVQEGLLRCAAPAGVLDLRLRSEGWVPLYFWGVTVEPGKDRDLASLPLRRGASVSGWIELENGGPPPAGCRLELAPETMGFPSDAVASEEVQRLALEAEVNERGFFQVVGVPPGRYALKASLPGFAPATLSPIDVRKELEAQILEPLVLGRPATLEVVLDPPVEPYGKPWQIRLLRLQYRGGPAVETFEGTASHEGSWKAGGLPPGFYDVRVFGELKDQWYQDVVEIRSGAPALHIDLPVLRVRGTVLQGKKPLSTSLWLSQDRRSLRFDSDAEGRFDGVLPGEGIWNAEVRQDAGGLRLRLDPIEVAAAPNKRVAEIEILVPDTRLAGEVVDESGQTVPGAEVSFHSLSKARRTGRFRTDENGRFAIRGVPAGTIEIVAREADRMSERTHASLEEGVESPWVRLVLRQPMRVEGRVVSSHGGVPGAFILAYPRIQGTFGSRAVQAMTGPQGEFDLLVPSEASLLDLYVHPPGFAFRMTSAVVGPGQILEIPVETTGGTLVIAHEAAPSSSTPSPQIVHGGAVALLDDLAEWAQAQGARPADPARLVIPNVEPGPYVLCVGPAAFKKIREEQEPPAACCASGLLSPHGELILKVPAGCSG